MSKARDYFRLRLSLIREYPLPLIGAPTAMIVIGTALVGLGLLFKDNFLRAVALIWTGELLLFTFAPVVLAWCLFCARPDQPDGSR